MPGLILSAPAAGAGQTTFALALMRLLTLMGQPVRGAKAGPGFLTPRLHEAACERPGLTLDSTAMSPDRIRALSAGESLLLIEGARGLFDAPAVADLARLLDLPVVLVIDCSRMAQSVAPLVAGFATHDPQVRIGGVILNRVAGADHAAILRQALAPLGLPVLAALPDHPDLRLPDPQRALVPAGIRPDLDSYLDRAAALLAEGIPGDVPPDLATLLALAAPLPAAPDHTQTPRIAPPAQTIAIARDAAFGAGYTHVIEDWHAAGAEIRFFSPLADEPVPMAEFLYLPGGNPEIHAGRLAANGRFMTTLRTHGERKRVYGEGGGFLVMGDVLTDAQGVPHQMAGLLNLATSFKKRQPQQGYRIVTATRGPMTGSFHAHEISEATTLYQSGDPLFLATDPDGTPRPPLGLREGRAAGSFAHLIDPA
ncbi:cobyrinate a,c-diamide synthase [Pseudooceanicola sp.]|uniref:cobyrinate a,c-diamide synthase n=1 Tax=Pseudooceanicola sp. TaxID=1914328 RepID=UPI0035C6EE26